MLYGNFSEDNLKSPNKQMRTVWDIPSNKEPWELLFGKHPTQKPIRLLKRIINLSSKSDDIMLTPFAGGGSECVAAKLLGKHYIGFELEAEYCKIAEERLNHTERETSPIKLF